MNERVTKEHLQRDAMVYVRQSSPGQVRAHTGSTQVQMGLRDKARALGWTKPKIICDDLGISAGGFAERAGFRKLVALAAMSQSEPVEELLNLWQCLSQVATELFESGSFVGVDAKFGMHIDARAHGVGLCGASQAGVDQS